MNPFSYVMYLIGVALNSSAITIFTLESMDITTVDLLSTGWFVLFLAFIFYALSWLGAHV